MLKNVLKSAFHEKKKVTSQLIKNKNVTRSLKLCKKFGVNFKQGLEI
jgi:hypothetical protein